MFCNAIWVHAHTTSCRADHQAVARHLDHRRGHPEQVVDGQDPGDLRQEPALYRGSRSESLFKLPMSSAIFALLVLSVKRPHMRTLSRDT